MHLHKADETLISSSDGVWCKSSQETPNVEYETDSEPDNEFLRGLFRSPELNGGTIPTIRKRPVAATSRSSAPSSRSTPATSLRGIQSPFSNSSFLPCPPGGQNARLDGDASDETDQGQDEGANEWFRSVPPALIVIRAPSPRIQTEIVDLALVDSDDGNVVQSDRSRRRANSRRVRTIENGSESARGWKT